MARAGGSGLGTLTVGMLALMIFAVLTAVVVAHSAPLPVDRGVQEWTLRHRAPLVGTARQLTRLGTGVVLVPALLLAGAAVGWRGRRWNGRRWQLLLIGPLLLGGGQLVRWTLMLAVGRPRPPVATWATSATGLSFPSGHATTATLGCGLIALIVAPSSASGGRRVAAVALALVAVLVGATRVLLGVHWVTDVVGGWALGVALLVVSHGVLARLPGTGSGRIDRPWTP